MVLSSSIGKRKLKFDDIRDLILCKEVCRRDERKTLGSGSTLNLETRGRGIQKF